MRDDLSGVWVLIGLAVLISGLCVIAFGAAPVRIPVATAPRTTVVNPSEWSALLVLMEQMQPEQ